MSDYLTDEKASLAATTAAFKQHVADESATDLSRTGPTTLFHLDQVKWAQERIAATGILAKIEQWRAEDVELAAYFGETPHAGGAPKTAALTDEHILIAMLLLAMEHSPMLTIRVRDFFWFRLPDDVRAHLGIGWGPETGAKKQQGQRWMTRADRALHRLLDVMDAFPAVRRVMNRAERDHQKALREENRERLNLDAKHKRLNEFTFAFIEMSVHMMGPEYLATWKGSVSIDQTTIKSLGKRGYAKGESKDPTLDSTVMELEAAWAVKDPGRRGAEGSDHKGEATFGYKANFATMVAEDPFNPSPHPGLIAAMTISTPGVDVGGEAVELLRQLSVNGYAPGRVTTDKEYAANMLPENYGFKVLALGYTIVTDYQKTRLGIRGNQRGAIILDGKHKCPAMPEKLKNYNEKFVQGIEADEELLKAGHRKSREDKRAELELHDRLYTESAKYNFKQKEGPDENGSVKLMCPARGKSATVSCSLHVPEVLTKNRDRAIVLNPPTDNPPECCKNEVVTMRPIQEWRDLQVLEYQSPAWRQTYKVDRNAVERSNSQIKDQSREALGMPGRRMLRGLTGQQLLVTFLVVTCNIRMVNSFRDAMAIPVDERTTRAPRARNGLTITGYDPRIAEVRARKGLAPLEKTRTKNAQKKARTLMLE